MLRKKRPKMLRKSKRSIQTNSLFLTERTVLIEIVLFLRHHPADVTALIPEVIVIDILTSIIATVLTTMRVSIGLEDVIEVGKIIVDEVAVAVAVAVEIAAKAQAATGVQARVGAEVKALCTNILENILIATPICTFNSLLAI